MTQITTRQSEAAPLTYRIDPLGALVGYAAVYEVPVKRSTRSQSRNSSREAFVPSCPFQWSLPTSMVRAPIVEPADAILDEDWAPYSPERPKSWLARLWSRYAAWRERQRTKAAWEALDTRTLRDIGALPDEVEADIRSIPYWGWHTIL
jgi:uncharacterized protein YjiS (DUF1127 family)